jgi:hypothetical protein
MNNRDLRKRVDIEQKFADYVFKTFKQKRYGICSPVNEEQLDKYTIKKELYQWSDWYNPKSYQIEYEGESWDPSNPEFPPWVAGEPCNDGCLPQQIFTPNEIQLANSGGQYFNESGGINNYTFIESSSTIFDLINESGHPQITIRADIDFNLIDGVGFFYPETSGLPFGSSISNMIDGAGTFTGEGNWASQPHPKPIVAQFYLLANPSGVVMPHFTYPDPHPYSTMTTIEHSELGTLYYDGSAEDNFYFTCFGNTKDIITEWSMIDGGMFFDQWADDGQLDVFYNDGNNSYKVTEGTSNVTFGNPYSPYFDINSELYDPTLDGGTVLPPNLLEDLLGVQFATAPVCVFIPLAGTFNYNGLFAEQSEIISFNLCELPGVITLYNGEEIVPGTAIGDPNLISSVCNDDIEILYIEAVDQDGNPVEGYEIILDGGNAGFTDQFGKFTTTIKNASEITNHTINVCYCFTTVGQCAQTKIKLVITEDGIIDNTLNKSDCINISESE